MVSAEIWQITIKKWLDFSEYPKHDHQERAGRSPELPREPKERDPIVSRDAGVRSGAVSWEGVQLSCSLTCSRTYCWQKQQGRSREPPAHSRPHETMMVDYLQEMSYAGPQESADNTLVQQSYTFQMTEGKKDKLSREIIHLFFFPTVSCFLKVSGK